MNADFVFDDGSSGSGGEERKGKRQEQEEETRRLRRGGERKSNGNDDHDGDDDRALKRSDKQGRDGANKAAWSFKGVICDCVCMAFLNFLILIIHE